MFFSRMKFFLGFFQKFPWDSFRFSSRDSFKVTSDIFTWIQQKMSSRISPGNLSGIFAWILSGIFILWNLFKDICKNVCKIARVSSGTLARDSYKIFSSNFKKFSYFSEILSKYLPRVLTIIPAEILSEIYITFLFINCSCGSFRQIPLDSFKNFFRIVSDISSEFIIRSFPGDCTIWRVLERNI